MIRLRTLGALDLRLEDGTEAQSVLRQPKRLALLAFLAVARPRGFQRRDRVLLTFWPELDRDRARGALNQSVFILRSGLGRDIVVNRGDDEIGIGADQLWCDAVAFDEAFERGDFAEALALYEGEFLAGFHVDDAADFERWLDEERSHRAHRAAEAAWALAENAGNTGDVAAARDLAARAISFGPWDERGLRRLMVLLDQAGDRAGAIAAFHDFARRLRADLEVEPSAETLELVEAIKARAEPNGGPEPAPLLAAAVPPAAQASASPALPERRFLPADVVPARPRTIAPAWRLLRERWTTAVLVVVMAVLGAFIVAPEDPEEPIRVAVLPVRDESPKRQFGHITSALTSNIIQLMHHPGRLHVVSEFGVRRFAQSNPTHQEIGRELDVEYIVSALLTGSGDRIKVTIELIDAANGERVAGTVVDKADNDWMSFTDDVGTDLARMLRSRLGEIDLERGWLAGTGSVEAWEAVVKANDLLARAIAAEEPPNFEYPRSLLDQADSLLWLAQREDRSWCVPFALLARTIERRAFMSIFDASVTDADRAAMFDTADAYVEHAIASDRSDATLWEQRGTLMHRRYLFAPPEPAAAEVLLDSAESNLRYALELEPLRARAANTLSMVLFARGEVEEAFDFANQAYANDAYLREIDNIAYHLFELAFHLDDDEASRWCTEVETRMPDTFATANCQLKQVSWGETNDMGGRTALLIIENFGLAETKAESDIMRPCLLPLAVPAVAADKDMGLDSARSILRRAREERADVLEATCLEYEAAALVAIGDHDEAFRRLEELLEELPQARARLAVSRFFRPLQADSPRWRKLFGH